MAEAINNTVIKALFNEFGWAEIENRDYGNEVRITLFKVTDKQGKKFVIKLHRVFSMDYKGLLKAIMPEIEKAREYFK